MRNSNTFASISLPIIQLYNYIMPLQYPSLQINKSDSIQFLNAQQQRFADIMDFRRRLDLMKEEMDEVNMDRQNFQKMKSETEDLKNRGSKYLKRIRLICAAIHMIIIITDWFFRSIEYRIVLDMASCFIFTSFMLTGIVIVIWLLYHLEGKQLESELNVLVKKNEVAQTKWQNLQQEYRRIEHIFNPVPA